MTTGGIANKVSLAVSRVVYNNRSGLLNDEDEIADLIQIIEDLN